MANILIQCRVGAHGAPASRCDRQKLERVRSHGNHGTVVQKRPVSVNENIALTVVRANAYLTRSGDHELRDSRTVRHQTWYRVAQLR